jgi:uncharacterized 2Fe-2S/4Fe-4S cluster protein (DUF4445 family)
VTVCVEFQPIGRRVEVQGQTTVLEAARLIAFPDNRLMSAPCGGQGRCGRCRIRVMEGSVSPPSEVESKLLSSEELDRGVRLACQAEVLGRTTIEIPPESLAGKQNLQVEGLDFDIQVQPATRRYTVATKASTIAEPLSSWQQIVRELGRRHRIEDPRIDLELLRQEIPETQGDRLVTVTVRGSEVVNRCDVFPPPAPLGMAVDLGTTKVAAFLVDLESGTTLASEAAMNPQISYGEDVMSRLSSCDGNPDQAMHMAHLLVACVNDLLARLATKTRTDLSQIEQIVIVGNSAMHHLMLGLPIGNLVKSPYAPTASLPIEVKARDLGIHLSSGASVYFAPLIAGFVGGDHVAMIHASRIAEKQGVTLGLDIGTNTEVVLSNGEHMVSCSCASGPAFEGAHIRNGMRAVEGAISRVNWDITGKRLAYQTIGNGRPLGFCGSGVIDAIAELSHAGIINRVGLMDRSHPDVRIQADAANPEYVIVPGTESGTGQDITLGQKEVVAIQLAKAAIRAGIQLLIAGYALTERDIDCVVLAGAFGSGINLDSAIAIGLLPDLPRERFCDVGNAAGVGARLMLISMAERRAAERLAEQVQYLELANHPDFARTFASCLEFGQSLACPRG